MSSCLTGGGRAYRLDLEIIKSPSSSWTSNSSSPSSTLSETSNSPLAISTRKPRTPRKRPNQTYNEAAALLSTAYPKIFSTKHLTKPCKFTKQQQYPFSYESSDLLLPFRSIDDSCFLIHHHPPPILEKSSHPSRQKQVSSLSEKSCQSPREISSKGNNDNNNNNNNSSLENFDDSQEDFDAESILDEEIEEGIDSILGDINVKKEYSVAEPNNYNNGFCCSSINSSSQLGTCYGYPVGLGFGVNYFEEYGYGMRKNSISAFRKVDDGEWWRYPSVNIGDITPKFNKPVSEKKKKKKVESKNSSAPASSSRTNKEKSEQKSPPQTAAAAAVGGGTKEESLPKSNFSALLLKLDYEEILNAWSDRSCPFSEDSPVSDATGNDVHARLAKIDLFTESGGIREASVMRYKEKRRTRLFSKKIRYQVRKVNADRRPRMKGRFVRRPNSPDSEQG